MKGGGLTSKQRVKYEPLFLFKWNRYQINNKFVFLLTLPTRQNDIHSDSTLDTNHSMKFTPDKSQAVVNWNI